MGKLNEKDNVISMLSGFTGDISTVVGVQISADYQCYYTTT